MKPGGRRQAHQVTSGAAGGHTARVAGSTTTSHSQSRWHDNIILLTECGHCGCRISTIALPGRIRRPAARPGGMLYASCAAIHGCIHQRNTRSGCIWPPCHQLQHSVSPCHHCVLLHCSPLAMLAPCVPTYTSAACDVARESAKPLNWCTEHSTIGCLPSPAVVCVAPAGRSCASGLSASACCAGPVVLLLLSADASAGHVEHAPHLQREHCSSSCGRLMICRTCAPRRWNTMRRAGACRPADAGLAACLWFGLSWLLCGAAAASAARWRSGPGWLLGADAASPGSFATAFGGGMWEVTTARAAFQTLGDSVWW